MKKSEVINQLCCERAANMTSGVEGGANNRSAY